MTVLYIVLAVLVFLLLLLLIPVVLKIEADDSLSLRLRYLFVSIDLTKPRAPKKKKDKKTDKAEKLKKPSAIGKMIEEKGISGAVNELIELAKAALRSLGRLVSHIAIKKLYLDVAVASDDASKTAIEYGAVCAAVYPFIGIVGSNMKWKNKQISVRTDYKAEKPSINLKATVSLRPIFVLTSAAGLAKVYISNKIKEGKNS